MLQENMEIILDKYNTHRSSQPGVDQNSIVYQIIEKELPNYISGILENEKFKVSGSVGAGRWAEVPWIGIFNKAITTSAQNGFYVCYLFGNNMESVYLTIIHSVTKERGGKNWGKEQIKIFVQSKRENLKAHISDIETIVANGIQIGDPKSFGSSSRASKYSESTIAYKEYTKENIPSEEVLIKDLKLFIDLYNCMDIAEGRLNIPDGVDEMAYSSETGNVNVDILQSSLNVTRKGAEVVFHNEELFIISPSIQNGSDWFDIRKVNLIRFHESGKKGLLILRHGENFLIADLNNFAQQMMQDETIKSTSTGGEHWKFNIISSGDIQAVYNQGNRNILFIFRFATIGNLEKETVKLIKSTKVYSPIIKGLDGKNQYGTRRDVNLMASKDLIPHIHTYITSKGFTYSLKNIKNLYLSLRSKPFVIISGISGTGKTKIVQLFAESMGATESNEQFKLIPVRPDWSDGSELLGYKDIAGNIVEGQLTKMVREASKEENQDRPYFLLLDEMNLARVEYYFSDVLSIMESRKKVNGFPTSAQLAPDIDPLLTLPNNLYIIGTVNMDETTHPFSKKVLDRANTIEFNEIDLNNFSFLKQSEEIEAIACLSQSLEASYLNLKDCYDDHKDLIERVSKQLANINEVLKEINAQVGYRVRDEICFYMIHNVEGKLLEEHEALDFCYMQKILPRISGADSVGKVLEKLHKLFSDNHPMSAKKAQEMLDRLRRDGNTSFWNL